MITPSSADVPAYAAAPVARMHHIESGDEFSVLALECDNRQGEALLRRARAKLAVHSIAASVGFAYVPAARLIDVWKVADEAMYGALLR